MNLSYIRLPGVATALLVVAGLAAGPVEAQQGTVAGQVTDKSNQQPVAGAQVLLVGTSLVARTSREGRYTIPKVPPGQYSVQVRLIGFGTATQPVTVAGDQAATVDFALAPAAVPLDAVVVSATGAEQLKRELGNNVGTIDAAAVAKQAAPVDAADLLNSRVPGVEVMQSGGSTGTGSRIRIRGATSLSLQNEPIIVVDGVRIDNSPQAGSFQNFTGGQAPSRINDLNPEDFQSVEVAKGPSAAVLYGTDAANGVIQFTSKQGRPGPTQWTGYVQGGALNDVTSWPANYVSKQASGSSCRLTSMARGLCTITKVDSYNPLLQNSPFRTGVRQQYGLSASGGSEATTFYVSGDFQREKGIFESNDLNKTSLRANLRNQVSRLLDVSVTSSYVSSHVKLPQNDNNNQGILSSALLGFPDTTNGGYRFLTPGQANQVLSLERIERFTGGLTANFRPWSFLTMRGVGGYDVTNQGDDGLTPPNVIPLSTAQLQGNATQNRAQTFAYTANFSSTATFRLSPRVTSNTTAGVQFYKNVFQQVQAFGRSVIPGTEGVSGVVFPSVHDTTAPAVTLGGFIEEAVALNDRLYLTGAIRRDGHSAFGQSFGAINYPKLSGSWVISEEPFFPRLGWLETLRLRAAWGKSGRAPEPLDALQFFLPVAVATGGTDVPGIAIGSVGNSGLRPEQTREFETGFDVDLIQRRLHFEATYYDKNSKDGLVQVPIAGSVGEGALPGAVAVTRLFNLGEVSNKGLEFVLTAQVVNTPNVVWSVTASAWGNRNRVLSTGPGNTPIIFGLGGSTQRLQVGYPAGGYWGRSYTFQDKNGDGLINPLASAGELTVTSDTDTFQGSSVPTHGGTLSTEVSFLGHFQLHGLLDGRFGNKLDNATESFRCLFAICAGARVPGVSLADQAASITAPAFETGFYQDAGFVKLREVSVTYIAPTQWASRLGASALSFTVTGRNLATWTNYKGADPEVNTIGQFNYSVADFLTQPPVRYFVGRVNVTF
jgi:TonB-linked SusC/RagA family outer membrane protein